MRRNIRSTLRTCAAALGALLLSSASLRAQVSLESDIDSYVARAMKEFQTPGAAIAVVKDGRMIFAKGYGVRRLGEPGLVDTTTVFRIASLSKAFTTAALATLVDEGRLRWNARVTDLLPGFQLRDPYATRELTLGDLLLHRAGIGADFAGDLLWLKSDYTPKEVLERIRDIDPPASFRAQFAYCNLCHITAAEIWSPRIITPPSAPFATLATYGLGWRIGDFNGAATITHSGIVDGMLSCVLLVPGKNVGVVVLTNGGWPTMDVVAYHVMEMLLGVPSTDWIARYHYPLSDGSAEETALKAARGNETAATVPCGTAWSLACYARG